MQKKPEKASVKEEAMEDMKELGTYVRSMRSEKKLKAADLAAALGMQSSKAWTHFEKGNGKTFLRFLKGVKLCGVEGAALLDTVDVTAEEEFLAMRKNPFMHKSEEPAEEPDEDSRVAALEKRLDAFENSFESMRISLQNISEGVTERREFLTAGGNGEAIGVDGVPRN